MWVPLRVSEPRTYSGVVPVPAPAPADQNPIRPPEDPKAMPDTEPASAGAATAEEGATRHGWPTIGALVGASLVVLGAIIGAALFAYRAAGSPPPNPVPTASARPVDPNALSYRYLAGVTVGGLTTALKGEGFSCAAPAPPADNLRNWRCDRARGTQHDVVQISAVDGDHVHLVDVTAVALSGPLDEQAVVELETRMAQLVYGASTEGAASATGWVSASPTGDATTSVGGITLRSDRTDVATLLEFDAGSRG